MSSSGSTEHGKSVYRHMVRGSTWAIALTWAIRGIGLANTVILARLLEPEDFGLVAMAALAFGLLDTFVNFGTGLLLIRQRDATREHCDTAWTISLLRGLVMAAILCLVAPLVAAYFGEQRVIPIVFVVAFNAALGGSVNVGIVLMRKELQFGREFRYIVFGRLFTFLATIALAWWLRNYWALVLGSTVGGLFQCWLSYRMHPYRPRFSLSKVREYVGWSVAIVPLNIFFYLSTRLDSFVVGRIAPAATLGLYNVAADLSTMLTSELTAQVGRALYPSYATVREEVGKLREAFLHSFSMLVSINVAFGLGLFAVSDDFVIVLLGAKWSGVVPLVAWLAIAGMLRGLAQSLTGNVLMVSGRERVAAMLMFLRFVILAVFAVAGASIAGPRGVAIGTTVGMALTIPLGVATLMRTLQVQLSELTRVAWRPFVAGAVMVVAVWIVHGLTKGGLIALVAEVLTGAAVFVVLHMLLWRISGSPAGPENALAQLVARGVASRRAVRRA
jgi:O-antigen/teichoic acid export membrane protein